MHAIPNPTWGGIVTYTWADLSLHQWQCFRIALFETGTEATIENVAILMPNHPRKWESLKKTRWRDLKQITWERLFVLSNVGETLTEQKANGTLIVQSPIIMQSKTEMIVSIVVSERDYLTDMMKHLPKYERTSNVMREVLTASDRELRNTEQKLEVVERNIFISKAIEMLPIYERDIGIENTAMLNYQQRREQIIARNIASFGQTVESTIKAVAAAFSNGEVDVKKTGVPGIYEIKFIGTKGVPNNIAGLKKSIDIIAPGHLQFDYTFTFNTWGMVASKTWGDVSGMTWNELKTWEGAS